MILNEAITPEGPDRFGKAYARCQGVFANTGAGQLARARPLSIWLVHTATRRASHVCSIAVKAERETEIAVIELFERFCSGVAARDREEVLSLFLEDADVAMVTSEEAVVRGPDELRAFLRA